MAAHAQTNESSLAAKRQELLKRLSAAGQAGNFSEAIRTAKEGIALAQQHDHDSTQSVFSLFAGMGYYEQQKKDSSIYYLDEAARLADALPNLALQVRSRLRLIDVYTQLDNARSPVLTQLMKDLEPLIVQLDNPRYTAGWEVAKGNVHNKRSETSLALDSFLRALEIYRSLNDKSNEGAMLTNIGGELMTLKRWKDAITYNQQAIQLFKQLNREHLCISSYMNIGSAFEKLKQPDSAMAYYEASLALAKKLGDQKNEAENKQRLAKILYRDSVNAASRTKADAYLDDALTTASAGRGDYEGLVLGFIQKGNAALDKKQFQQARQYFDQAMTYAQQSQHKQLLRDAYLAEATLLQTTGNGKAVYNAMQTAYQYHDSIFDEQMAQNAAELEARYQSAQKQQEIEKLNRENEIARLEQQQQRQQFIFLVSIGAIVLVLVAGSVIFWRDIRARKQMVLKERELHELNQRIAETRQIALRAQMNPHFIFNCMAAADGYIMKNDRARASELLTRFAKLVRHVLENSEHTLITLEDELQSLELFLSIEQMRFQHSFAYGVNADTQLLDFEVPPLLFQPYVENALIHGVGPDSKPDKKITIDVTGKPGNIVVTIRDNGIGRKAAAQHKLINPQSHQSMGTRITAERLSLLSTSHHVSAKVEVNDLTDAQGEAAGTEVIVHLQKTIAATA
ncbi:MAG: histidine kinase [Cyclobacteriaceae bacterium]|nr:histidine kinase [Cyclobacteriaceae bacterium]